MLYKVLLLVATSLFVINCKPYISNVPFVSFEIQEFVDDGAWLWFNNENIIVDGKSILIGYEDSYGVLKITQCELDSAGRIQFTNDFIISTWDKKILKYPTHNYPSLLKLHNGSYLVVYHNSSNKMFYRIMEKIDTMHPSKELILSSEEIIVMNNNMNYNNLIQLKDEDNQIFNFFSIYKQSPSLILSDKNIKWKKDFKFMNAGKTGTSPYAKFADNGKDRIDMVYTDGHPRTEYENNIYHIYYYQGRLHQSDGTLISELINLKDSCINPDDGTKIYNGKTLGPGWIWDVENSNNNTPVAAFISSRDASEGNDLRYYYARWNTNKTSWESHEIAYAGSHLYEPENHFAGGITIDPNNSNIVYISSNVNPLTGRLNKQGKYQIYCGITKNEGKHWKWEQLTSNENYDNIRPIVPRNHKFNRCIFWIQYPSENNLMNSANIVGIIE